MIIAVVNQKGGTGKTTLATNLAVCFAHRGTDVLLIDADPQQSALHWRGDRPATLPPLSVVGLPPANLAQEVRRLHQKYDLLLIDGGGRITTTARAAVGVADFLLVPTLASRLDVLSTRQFFQTVVEETAVLKGRVRGAIVITMLKSGTRFSQHEAQQMSRLGYPVLATQIAHRIVYQEAAAHGMAVTEYAPRSKATQEIATLFQELQEILDAENPS